MMQDGRHIRRASGQMRALLRRGAARSGVKWAGELNLAAVASISAGLACFEWKSGRVGLRVEWNGMEWSGVEWEQGRAGQSGDKCAPPIGAALDWLIVSALRPAPTRDSRAV